MKKKWLKLVITENLYYVNLFLDQFFLLLKQLFSQSCISRCVYQSKNQRIFAFFSPDSFIQNNQVPIVDELLFRNENFCYMANYTIHKSNIHSNIDFYYEY